MSKEIEKLEINLKNMIEEALTPGQYIFLYFLNQGLIDEAYNYSCLQREDVQVLEKDEYLKIVSQYRRGVFKNKEIPLDEPLCIIQERGKQIFNTKDIEEKALEFWNAYPVKTPGGRVLRPKDPNSLDGVKVRNRYLKIIRHEPGLHEKILKALDAYTKEWIKSGKGEYLHGPHPWINGGIYQRYLNIEPPKSTERVQGI